MRSCKPMDMNILILMRAGMAIWMNTGDLFLVKSFIRTDFRRSLTMFIIMDKRLGSI
ncbi:hypothetical protein D3C71_995430 [compost metagenome]